MSNPPRWEWIDWVLIVMLLAAITFMVTLLVVTEP